MAQIWRQMAAAPKAMARIAIRSMIAEFGLSLGASFLYVLLLSMATSICRVRFHADVPDWASTSMQCAVVSLLVPIW
jgi:hypothetical protein